MQITAESPAVVLDPGNERTAMLYVAPARVVGGLEILYSATLPNKEVRRRLLFPSRHMDYSLLVVETPKPRGMPTAAEEMETLVEIGRFIECAVRRQRAWSLAWRQEAKLFLCGASAKVTDANIRAALIDYFGGQSRAIGGVKCEHCKGRGDLAYRRPCDDCGGSGKTAGKRAGTEKKCPTCKGRGSVPSRRDCQHCRASGWRHKPGPLRSLVGDQYAALAIAVTWFDRPEVVHRIVEGGSNRAAARRRRLRDAGARRNYSQP